MATTAAFMAHCLTASLESTVSPLHDRLATALSLDMAAWWQPTANSYLGRLSKPLILQAATEGVTAQAAANIASLKKAEMAARAEWLLTGTNWLPPLLRAA